MAVTKLSRIKKKFMENHEKERMITVAFCNVKGGVGKSSLSIALARHLKTRLEAKVLCLDLDTQNNSLSFYMTQEQDDSAKNITEAYREKNLKKQIETNKDFNIDFVRSSERIISLEKYPTEHLKDMLQTVEKNYDFCIIDTTPYWSNVNISVAHAADKIIIPTTVDPFAAKSLLYLLELLQEQNVASEIGILINMFKESASKDPENIRHVLNDLFKNELIASVTMQTRIPVLTSLQKLITYPSYKISKASKFYDIMNSLVEELFL